MDTDPSRRNTPSTPPVEATNGGMKVIQPISSSDNQVENTIPNISTQSSNSVPSPTQTAPTPVTNSSTINIYPEPTNLITRAQAENEAEKANKKKRLKRVLLFTPLILITIGAIVAALNFTSILPISKFKNITYDNGRGSSFQLKFYSRHSVKDAPGSKSGLQELVSKVSNQGFYPLTLNITKGTQKPRSNLLNCGYPYASSETLKILNKPTGNEVNLCSIHNQGINAPILYLGILQSGSDYYALLFNQDANFKKILSSPQEARAGLQKIDISAYSSDIKTIVASVKPL
ncbi:MAG TPA: hypothetical protein VLF63_03475 [Patescibacteria group bacterium]|nr:hypothetical protein [Patescibacteria group bacterium]